MSVNVSDSKQSDTFKLLLSLQRVLVFRQVASLESCQLPWASWLTWVSSRAWRCLSLKNVTSNLPLNVRILQRVCGYITMASLVKFRMNSEISMLSVCLYSNFDWLWSRYLFWQMTHISHIWMFLYSSRAPADSNEWHWWNNATRSMRQPSTSWCSGLTRRRLRLGSKLPRVMLYRMLLKEFHR